MAIHFVADLHFNGDNARHAYPHGFADSAERTRRICETWRARVAPTDTVWILGNVGNPVHLAGLPGTKHLVRGAQDPQPWNCLATRRYASVCDFRRLDTEYGEVALLSDPSAAAEMDCLVLHGQGPGQAWEREGFVCVSADQTGWGPVSLDQILRGPLDVRHAA
ncbi:MULTISPECIES: phosphoesterase [unclassified Novosphingobium]|uniref:phosphoesterase n=1 Tax=unclassified Novosphingobium TaxID=2644732 RepID=UPI00135948E4|nr:MULTISPECIES: phosphoesterase [unclassified Novosphingobium]